MEKQNKQKKKRCSLERCSTVTKIIGYKERCESVRRKCDFLWPWFTFDISSACCPLNSWGKLGVFCPICLSGLIWVPIWFEEGFCLWVIRLLRASQACSIESKSKDYAGRVMRWISSPAGVSDTSNVLWGRELSSLNRMSRQTVSKKKTDIIQKNLNAIVLWCFCTSVKDLKRSFVIVHDTCRYCIAFVKQCTKPITKQFWI